MKSMLSIFFALLACFAFTFAEDDSDEEKPAGPTTFNGVEVPPITLLTGETLDKEIAKGNWLVEFYSPYCGHCQIMAPVLQTAYEYYYTSNPVPGQESKPSENSLNSFSRFYDFKFAKVNCVVDGDTCNAKDGRSTPTFVLYKDGVEVKRHLGGMPLDNFSTFMEECLETIRPGSRPKDGVKLPKVGAHSTSEEETKPAVSEEKDKNPAAGSAAASAHNAIATAEVADEAQAPIVAKPADSKPKDNVNVDGKSVVLDSENFPRLVTNSRDAWFVKFYAPWCGHCQHLAPTWAQMAKEMKGQLNIGEVNCDVEKRLCKEAGVRGYPTMLFFRGPERVEYDGLRGIGDLLSFGRKLSQTNEGVLDVDFADFTKLEETEDVIFVYFYDHATTSEDFAALDRLTLSLVGHAKLVKTSDAKLVERFKISSWPRLVVSRSGIPTPYTPLAPKDIRDIPKVSAWMAANRLPLVPELTAANARDIMSGKLVVLAILLRENKEEFAIAQRELKNVAVEWIEKQAQMQQLERQELRDAKQLRIEEAEDRGDARAVANAKRIRIEDADVARVEIRFAWVDGGFWDRWIQKTYGIDARDGARVIINDEENRQYFDTTLSGSSILASRTSISETLRSITAPGGSLISPRSTSLLPVYYFYRIKNLFVAHPIGMGIGVSVLLVGGILYSRRGIRGRGRAEGNTWRPAEKGGLGLGLGGGFGGGRTGKKD